MHAAVLHSFGTPLVVEDRPDPEVRAGDVLVEVAAAGVLPYAAEVFSGRRRYPLEPPVVPGSGGIGRVAALGADATRLRIGDWVWCDPTVRSRDDAGTPDITLQGWSSRGHGGLRLSRHYHDGSWSTRIMVPTENVHRLGETDVDTAAAARWTAIGVHLVPYGGLVAGDLRAGETVLVSGATGNFGSAGAAVALAMGAGLVLLAGRNADVLTNLRQRLGDRVRTVTLTGDEDTDRTALQAAADRPIDLVLDLLPPAAGVGPVRAAAMTSREFGRVVLMGGVGMLGGTDLTLPYPWLMRNSITVRGQWMYPRTANTGLIQLVRSGLLDLTREQVTTFRLDEVNAAITHAADHGRPFERTVLLP